MNVRIDEAWHDEMVRSCFDSFNGLNASVNDRNFGRISLAEMNVNEMSRNFESHQFFRENWAAMKRLRYHWEHGAFKRAMKLSILHGVCSDRLKVVLHLGGWFNAKHP